MLSNVFSLNKEDKEFVDLINKNSFFLHTLLPNQVNIFSLKEIDENVINYIRIHNEEFLYLIYPVYKHSWYAKNLYILEGNRYSEVICSNNKNNNLPYEFFNIVSEEEVLIKSLANERKHKIVDNRIILEREGNRSLSLTFEAYAYLYLCLTKEITRNEKVNKYFILGLVEAAMKIGIVSVPFKQTKKPFENKYGFQFAKVPLKSLYISNQIRLFDIWKMKEDTLLTGGTGIGKTSQVPKLFWWFNFLFDGFEEDIDFENFYFNLTENIKIKKRITVLSLPRKILINENSMSIAKSIGFNAVQGSPINCKYKDVKDTDYFNPSASQFISSFLCSVNRSTTYENVNTIIFDEIHEHDTFCDIGISIINKLKKEFGIRNLILITATIIDDLPVLKKFMPNIKHIHIKGETLFPITEYDMFEKCNRNNNYLNLDKLITTHSIEKGQSSIIFFSSGAQLLSMKETLESKLSKFYKIVLLSRQTLMLNPGIIKDNIMGMPEHHVIILSTPIAESSITIPNAKVVYDTGLFYCKQFFGGRTIPITQSMLEQRKGRIGRVSTGVYIKLFNEVNQKFKKIDYEFLFPYILSSFYYGLSFKDLFIQPSNRSRFDDTLKYFKERGLNIKKDYKKIMVLFNTNVVALDEYYIILMKGTKSQKEFIKALDHVPTSEIDIFIRDNKSIVTSIVKDLNIQCNIHSTERFDRCEINNYFETIPSFIVRRMKGFGLRKNYLFSPDLVIV